MIGLFNKRSRGARVVTDIDAEARVVEKAELQKLLRDRGICLYDTRTMGNGDYDQDLVREVRNEWYEKATRPSKTALVLGIIFDVPAHRI